MGEKARARLRTGLDRLGVAVRVGVDIVKVMSDGVALADGEVIPAQAVLWTTGVRVSPTARGRRVSRWTTAAGSSPMSRCGRCRTRTSTLWATRP